MDQYFCGVLFLVGLAPFHARQIRRALLQNMLARGPDARDVLAGVGYVDESIDGR